MEHVTRQEIVEGLQALGLSGQVVVVHASLGSFGRVEGGAQTLVDALLQVCDTITMMAASDGPAIPAPPGFTRPHNAFWNAADLAEFDAAIASATRWRHDLPVSSWLGVVSETLRAGPRSLRGPHPLYGFVAAGQRAADLVAAERVDRMVAAIERAGQWGGQVLLLGVDHSSNTTIHLAEQLLGRARFFRYAVAADGVWCEVPNVTGESHRFEEFEARLRPFTREVRIGQCRARVIAIADVLREVTEAIIEDPTVGLCQDQDCRCVAGLGQYLAANPGPLPVPPQADLTSYDSRQGS